LEDQLPTSNINATTKLQRWKDVVGGKIRGQCYGTTDLAINIRYGVSPLIIQPSLFAHSDDYLSQNEQLHQQMSQANENAETTNQKVDQENQREDEEN